MTKKIKLMTHIVIGYPDLNTSKELVETMLKTGVDMIELQIPFSDPLADGQVIRDANTIAVEQGIGLDDVFKFAKTVSTNTKTPFYFVTYFNSIVNLGTAEFCRLAAASGVSGLIVPDYNIDHEPEEKLIEACRENNLSFIPLISPITTNARLEKLTQYADDFVYCTARLGITGKQTDVSKELGDYLARVKEHINKPIAVGFGIRERKQIDKLADTGHADIAVIGSQVLKVLDKKGIRGTEIFLKKLVG